MIMAQRLLTAQPNDAPRRRRMHFRDLHEFGFVRAEARGRHCDPVVDLPWIRALPHVLREVERRLAASLDRRADAMDILALRIELIHLRTGWLREIRPAHAVRRNAACAEQKEPPVRPDRDPFVDDRARIARFMLVRSRDLWAISDQAQRDLVIRTEHSDRATRRSDLQHAG